MAESLADIIMRKVSEAAGLRHRLVLAVAPFGTGQTDALHEVNRRTGAPLLNLSPYYSLRMLGLTEEQWQQEFPRILGDLVSVAEGDLVLLYDLESHFAPRLNDPLRLLKRLSRKKTIVVALEGWVSDGLMLSAPNGKKYPIRGFLVATPETKLMGEDDWPDMCEAPRERLRRARKQLRMIKMMLMSEPHDEADRQGWDAINEWLRRAEEQLDRLAIAEEHTDLDGNGHQFSVN